MEITSPINVIVAGLPQLSVDDTDDVFAGGTKAAHCTVTFPGQVICGTLSSLRMVPVPSSVAPPPLKVMARPLVLRLLSLDRNVSLGSIKQSPTSVTCIVPCCVPALSVVEPEAEK